MDRVYTPYFDPDYDSLIERIHPPSVCIDNDTCQDCTLVKVDSANKHGILLEMVQVLTDLDLVILKSYICSDGGWFMDVFHVTDQLGNKLTDESLLLYIQQVLCARRGGQIRQVPTCLDKLIMPQLVSTEHTALEMTGTDRPGLLSEISAVLAQLGCHITAAEAWTYNTRAACIIYLEDGLKGGAITDPERLAQVEEQLENVVDAHHKKGEKRSVRLTAPGAGRTHTERRLHQLMFADRDFDHPCDSYGDCSSSGGGGNSSSNSLGHNKGEGTQVTIENCKEKGYSVVHIKSEDRPKLLFDTVCALTDMQYVVFHATVSSKGSTATQEYYIRHKDGCTLDTVGEKQRVIQSLVAAIERRVSHGLRLDVCTSNKTGLLSDITRVFRENGLSITRAEVGTQGEKAIGFFYITDASGRDVDMKTIESVRKEIGGVVKVIRRASSSGLLPKTPSTNSSGTSTPSMEARPRFSLGGLLWSRLEQLSNNFRPIRS
ncbi:ACT domain [Dillenia turbinata]|uniref:ACT domain-containing protein ACR n=1 Tax=Dillenia turbinata TaxID=194707 RepID=A0AAN8VB12_9MAGN